MDKPIVALVGRPNVGKSTLFNRIVGRRLAIVEDIPGITRDRLYADAEWRGRQFAITDTGGILMGEQDPLRAQVVRQARLAMQEADVIVLVVDAREGVTATDREIADELRKTRKPVLVAVNKADNDQLEREAAEFYSLGLGGVYPVSGIHGRGVAELLDAIMQAVPVAEKAEELPEDVIKLAIVGRPNVGKSSLLNAILGEERVIVSSVPGTTRDAVDTFLERGGQRLVLIDTAGIRRAGKIQGSVEYYTVLRATRAIERSDVALIVVDAGDGVTDGDKRVAGLAHNAGRAAVIVVNKWDLRQAGPERMSTKEFADLVRQELAFMAYAPIVFTSAKQGTGVSEAVDAAIDAAENHAMRIPTAELNRIIQDAADAHPLMHKGRQLKIRYATMPTVKPPTVVLFVNDPEMLHFSYQRYLENQIRKVYPYQGTPIRIVARKAEKEQ